MLTQQFKSVIIPKYKNMLTQQFKSVWAEPISAWSQAHTEPLKHIKRILKIVQRYQDADSD